MPRPDARFTWARRKSGPFFNRNRGRMKALHYTEKLLMGLWIILAVAGALKGQSHPILLKKITVKVTGKPSASVQRFVEKYRNRPVFPGWKKNFEQRIVTFLRENGYYFPKVKTSRVEIDSAKFTASFTFQLDPGPQTLLQSVEFQADSTSPEELQKQLLNLVQPYYGQPYTALNAKKISEEIIDFLEQNGFPLANLETRDFKITASDGGKLYMKLLLQVNSGEAVNIKYVKYSGMTAAQTHYLNRLLGFKSGEKYNQKRVDKYAELLRKQDFLKKIEPATLMRDKEGRFFLNFAVEEAPGTSFDGIIGYIPPAAGNSDQSGYLTGLFNVGIRNLFGPGRKFQVFWQKQDRLTDEFRLNYQEPFIFGLPLNAAFGVNRLVRDTTYIEFQYRAGLSLPLNEELSAFVRFSSREVTPDSLASRVLRLPRTQTLTTETGLRWNLEDDLLNPRKGLYFEIAWSIGSQRNNGPDYLLTEDSLASSVTLRRVKADLSLFLPTFRHQVLSNHFHTEVVGSSGGELRLPDLIWFGGATTVRGFRESQFNANRVFWTNSEYRFLLSRQSRFFLFMDNAFFSRKKDLQSGRWLTSYGLGIRIPGPLGLFQVDFGLSKNTPFREGKIHFRLINEF